MGRTVPTFRRVIESFGLEWTDFKKTLRAIDKEAFESLLNHARKHAAAGHNFPHPSPFEPIVISMLLEHEKTIHLLCEQLQEKKDGEQSNDTQNDL
jgi:hypothetical protein